MIHVILQGRTGNNLFQYAAGRALAIQHKTGLVLDGAWADTRHARQFEHLLRLPIQARYERRFTLTKRSLNKAFHIDPATLHRGPVFRQLSPIPDPAFHEMPDGTLLVGFFQSPLYFQGIESVLREELDLTRLVLPTDSLRFEDLLQNQTTVSLHVRRGDYVHITSTQCLAPDYHEQAVQHFRQRFPGVRFCVFSDDIPWCRKQFPGPEFLFCDLPGAHQDPFHDLRLMAACSHHIIVNSSYSWWGAWLNHSLDKIVIAPTTWMRDLSSAEILLPSWISI